MKNLEFWKQDRFSPVFFTGKEKLTPDSFFLKMGDKGKCADVKALRPSGYEEKKMKKKVMREEEEERGYSMADKNWGQYLLWFIVITLIAWIILYVLKPAFLQSRWEYIMCLL